MEIQKEQIAILFQKKASSDKVYRLNRAMIHEVLLVLGYPAHRIWHMIDDLFDYIHKIRELKGETYISKEEMKIWLSRIQDKYKTDLVRQPRSYFYALAKMKNEKKGVVI